MATTTPAQSRATTAILWIAGFDYLLAVIFGIRYLTRDETPVHVAPATFQTLSSTVPTNGKVEPVGEFQAHAPSAGVVQHIYVDVGQHVAAGARLVDMDSADARKQLTAAESNLAAAESNLADLTSGGNNEERGRFSNDIASAKADQQQAQQSLDIEQRLQARGSSSTGAVLAAQQKLDSANATLRNAQARTSGRYSTTDRTSAQARVTDAKAGIAAARAALGAVTITSPRAGTVYSIPVNEYDYVPAGDDLVDVADLNHLQVHAYFDEPDIGKLARGQAVKITWEAKPGMTWHGHIELPPTTVVTYQNTRNVGECIISVDDAHGDLLPNTNVTVTVTESQRFNILSIPREALHTDGPITYVFRIVNNRLVRTPIKVGIFNLTSVEVLSGLSDKDLVVLGPAISGKDLVNGMEVKPVS